MACQCACVLYESDSMAIESTERIMDGEIKRRKKRNKISHKQINACTSCAPLPSSQRNIYLFRFGINGIDILHYYYYNSSNGTAFLPRRKRYYIWCEYACVCVSCRGIWMHDAFVQQQRSKTPDAFITTACSTSTPSFFFGNVRQVTRYFLFELFFFSLLSELPDKSVSERRNENDRI